MADAANAPISSKPQIFQTNALLFSWDMSGVSTGYPVNVTDYPDKTFQAYEIGSAWGSATLVLEGSNDERANPEHPDYENSVWGTLTDTGDSAISTTVDIGPVQVVENPIWVRPRTSGGTGTVVKANIAVKKG